MKAHADPFHAPAWDATDLAHAVPLQLSQSLDFDALRDGPLPACGNDAASMPRFGRGRYAALVRASACFSVH